MAQIRLTLTRPHQISSGSLSLDFDPAIFGPPAAVDVFSATGDQVGRAVLTGNHLDVEFRSATGGIGRLPGAPLLVVTIPVLGSAKDGAATSISFSPGERPWKDVLGYLYTPSVAPARFKVGGALSIDSVTPGGGLLPSGTKVRVAGRGFLRSTEVRIDGVVLASVSFVGPQALDVTLGAPTDLTGRRVLVRNPDGAQADFYPALARKFYDARHLWSGEVQPIFPQQTYVQGALGPYPGGAIQNPTLAPMPIDFVVRYVRSGGGSTLRSTGTLEPGEVFLYLAGPQLGYTTVGVSSGAPVRMMLLDPVATGEGPGPLSVSWDGPNPACFHRGDVKPMDTPCWLAAAGGALLKSHVKVGWSAPVPFDVAPRVEGGQWLTLSTEKARACASAPCDPQITLTADPRIPPGDYQATLSFTAEDPTLLPVALTFIFRVARSVISVEDPKYIFFSINESIYSRGPARVRVNSTADPMPFSVSIRKTQGSDWISVMPTAAVTPATLEIYVNPVPPERHGTAIIDILGPFNTVTVVVSMYVASPPLPPPPPSASPSSLTFWAKTGAPAPDPQRVNVPLNTYTITTATEQGGAWLSVEKSSGDSLTGAVPSISVKVDTVGLKAGAYRGSVTFAVSSRPDVPPGRIPVTLVVWEAPPEVVLTPSELTVSTRSGAYPDYPGYQTISASSVHGLVSLAASATMEDGSGWLAVFDQSYRGYYYAPAPYGSAHVAASAEELPPGTYRGSIRVTAPVGSPVIRTIPVTLRVEPGVSPYPRPGPPLATSIVNAASLTGGPVAAGEIVTLLGLNLGPHSPAHLSLGGDGKVTTSLAGLRVLFDGIPAPLLYAADVQVNAVVPYEIAGRAAVPVAVEFNGQRFSTGIPVAASAPALFTADGTGRGQARATNQDGSPNGTAHPAPRGWAVRFLATGVGRTTPAGTTGEISRDPPAEPALPVSVKIGGVPAVVRQIGPVPGQVAGLFQFTVVVPAEVKPGLSVPVVLTVGSSSSPEGVTIAVQ